MTRTAWHSGGTVVPSEQISSCSATGTKVAEVVEEVKDDGKQKVSLGRSGKVTFLQSGDSAAAQPCIGGAADDARTRVVTLDSKLKDFDLFGGFQTGCESRLHARPNPLSRRLAQTGIGHSTPVGGHRYRLYKQASQNWPAHSRPESLSLSSGLREGPKALEGMPSVRRTLRAHAGSSAALTAQRHATKSASTRAPARRGVTAGPHMHADADGASRTDGHGAPGAHPKQVVLVLSLRLLHSSRLDDIARRSGRCEMSRAGGK